MGNVISQNSTHMNQEDIWWSPQRTPNRISASSQTNKEESSGENSIELLNSDKNLSTEEKTQTMDEFQEEFQRKHEKRRQILANKKAEFESLRNELERVRRENEDLKHSAIFLEKLQKENRQLQMENQELKLKTEQMNLQINTEELQTKNKELSLTVAEMQLDIQNLNAELLNIEQERLEYTKHIRALKDVVKVTKNMLEIRESQIQGLKVKVQTVEDLLASKELKIMSDGLREEYEKQLKNIRNLRTLYEERQRLDKIEKEHLQVQMEENKKLVEEKDKICKDRLERIEELELDNSNKFETIMNLQSNLGLSKAECSEMQAEIDIINQLFSQILLGFNNTQEVDLDKLINMLEENHELLTNIAVNEESTSTAAALPKVLLDLITGIEKGPHKNKELSDENVALHQLSSPQEIVEILPKVWRILIELLSHHRQNPPATTMEETNPCYKSIDTPMGPKLKISVSQTFIRLKDLIMEKRFLEREMFRLNNLNTHLKGRLEDQEKRLSLVTGEVTKTWLVVDKLQRQHQQLHTHEKVLRHELREKRKLLANLREELECCREKWTQAREKNDNTQAQWKELRREFAARKVTDYFNQSAESGYSDDKDSSEDEERDYESDESEIKKDRSEESINNACGPLQLENKTESTDCEIIDGKSSSFPLLDLESSEMLGKVEVLANNDGQIICKDLLGEIMNSIGDGSEEQISKDLSEQKTGAIKKAASVADAPSCSFHGEKVGETEEKVSSSTMDRSPDEILAAREERLKRLEEESQKLFSKVTKTNIRSSDISIKLDSLHEIYGEKNSESDDDD